MNRYNNNMKMVNVRLFHATPSVPSVDVYINDRLIKQGLNYKESTTYIPLMKGSYNVKLNLANTDNVLLNQTLNINENRYLTIVALSENNKVGLLSLPDKSKMNEAADLYQEEFDMMKMYTSTDNMSGAFPADYTIPSRKELVQVEDAFVRFVHLSPNAPSVDITTTDGTVLFSDVIYKEATDYLSIMPGTYDLLVKPHNSQDVVLRLPGVVLESNDVKTIYAVGLVGGTPKLEVVVLNDGV